MNSVSLPYQLESIPFIPTREQMVAFALAVHDTLPNIHTDRSRAQSLGMQDVVVDGRMLALVISRQVVQCFADEPFQVTVSSLELKFRRPVHPGMAVRTCITLDDVTGENVGDLEVVTDVGAVVVTGRAVVSVTQ